MGKLKSTPKVLFIGMNVRQAKLIIPYAVFLPPREVLIKPCALIEMQGSEWEN